MHLQNQEQMSTEMENAEPAMFYKNTWLELVKNQTKFIWELL